VQRRRGRLLAFGFVGPGSIVRPSVVCRVVVLALIALLAGCDARAPGEAGVRTADNVTGIRYLAGGGDTGFRRADGVRNFRFPEDHGPHPGFRTEWWYFTGNLTAENGRHFGLELTFFRLGITATPQPRASGWQDDSVWMAHFAVTDTGRQRFSAAERLARSHSELAFARADPFEVRVEDFSVAAAGVDAIRLSAQQDGYAIDLVAAGLEDIVLQGDRGYDAKGPEPGNASYYYSAPNLAVSGTLSAERDFSVSGTAWFDREWSTSGLSAGVEGWEWFALQLDDGTRLMYYRLRQTDGSPSPFSGGTLVTADGSALRLGPEAVDAEPTRRWRSRTTGVEYPVAWRLAIPSADLELDVDPVLDGQELDLSVRYWEGAVVARGERSGVATGGTGYLELAGYQ